MSLIQRHQYILDQLQKEGEVKVADLCEILDVSSVTIRKDLKFLEEKKLLFRTHGSATLKDPYVNDRSVEEKKLLKVDEKESIAIKAAEMVLNDEAIIIGSGTTMASLAYALRKKSRLTVLTAAMNVTLTLIDHPDIEIVQLGGIVRKSSSSVVGNYAEDMIQNFACSKLFLGVDGITLDFGLTTSNMMEAHLNREMMRVAQKTIVLADSSKFGKRGFGKICGIEDIDHIITDHNISENMLRSLEALGIEVSIV
ncbi:MAG: DeoR/GlpR transcriptional regulator [Cyclobacteriaceae bacterium]|nr:DeoR/GlpR transcriptional regulator [Cyclobacteriaceae bacterium]